MTAKDLIAYWQTTAAEDLKVAEELFKLGHYNYCLFFSHLAIEKLLKGLIFNKTDSHAPPIHDLGKLAKIARLTLTETQKDELSEMTSWNIKARYDAYKREFYKKANKNFTTLWFSKTRRFYTWLKNQY